MGRRFASVLMKLIASVAEWPRGVAVLLAAASFAGLHWLAGASPPVEGLGSLWSTARAAGAAGQILVPGVIVAGALLSLFRELWRADLLDTLARRLCARAGSAVSAEAPLLTAHELAALLGEVYAREGYSVMAATARDDSGIDLVLRSGDEELLVECKPRAGRTMGVEVIRTPRRLAPRAPDAAARLGL